MVSHAFDDTCKTPIFLNKTTQLLIDTLEAMGLIEFMFFLYYKFSLYQQRH
jgi:hypothetical protein